MQLPGQAAWPLFPQRWSHRLPWERLGAGATDRQPRARSEQASLLLLLPFSEQTPLDLGRGG